MAPDDRPWFMMRFRALLAAMAGLSRRQQVKPRLAALLCL
jgi:hypothetical protein